METFWWNTNPSWKDFNPIQDGRRGGEEGVMGKKAPLHHQLIPCNFYNRRKLALVPVPNYWTWTKTTPQKIGFSG